ncbi:MAG: XrtA/PEP-CTERM system histidine kinase PrsK [Verrucomicrobiota bacterium]
MSSTAFVTYASAIFSALVGLAALLPSKRTATNWFFFAGMFVLGLESLFTGASQQAQSAETILRWQTVAGITSTFLPGIWLIFSLSYSRGNYREFLARWRPILFASVALPILLLGTMEHDYYAPIQQIEGTDDWVLPLTFAGKAFNVFLLVGILLVLINLEKTFRSTVGTLRWRIKFVVLGLCVIFGARIYACSQALLYSRVFLSLAEVEAAALLIGCLLIAVSQWRAGQFEVDVYPSHTFLYSSITILITGIYFLIVGTLAKVVIFLGGDTSFPVKALFILIGMVGFAVILLSDRVRQTIQRFVSRNFKRPLYDSRKVWSQFTEKTAHATNPASLCEATTKLVSDTFNILSATIWLVDETEKKVVFIASTALPGNEAPTSIKSGASSELFLSSLKANPFPFDLEESKEPWAVALRDSNPASFNKGGHRICVPIFAAERPLGVMILGDRVNALPYSLEELDLLRCIGGHVGASLRTLQLSKKLMEANEQEAFRAVSAFFAHDLKNAASTLSLMLQNLPLHFDDPEFRADVLRGISKTVNHMNHLIGRLSVLREKPELKLAETDLNEIVTTALGRWKSSPDIVLETELRPLPRLPLDADQIQNVVINLVLNAHEAIARRGKIGVQTAEQNGWVVLTVADDGCGMTEDYMRHSLFRPFQTTKKGGTGIGMFQCKMVIEAHRGRIEVESQPGKGSTFSVLLPLP